MADVRRRRPTCSRPAQASPGRYRGSRIVDPTGSGQRCPAAKPLYHALELGAGHILQLIAGDGGQRTTVAIAAQPPTMRRAGSPADVAAGRADGLRRFKN